MSYNIITLPSYDRPGATITPVDGTYADAMLATLEATEGYTLRPMEHTAVATLRKYSPLQAWEIRNATDKVAIVVIAESV